MDQKLLINGYWCDGASRMDVRNKFTGQTIGTVAVAGLPDLDRAIDAAEKAAPVLAGMAVFRRAEILHRASVLVQKQRESLAPTLAAEAGKALKYAFAEVDRCAGIFQIAAEEAKQIHGEVVPMDAVPAGEGYFGFWTRKPVGVIAAISPFNFPLTLVAHKVAPAIAAGNSVVLKPASFTPFSAGHLCRILQEAGLPDGGLNLITGPGGAIGDALVADPRVMKVTFTGSRAIGERIIAKAGIKKVTLELGNNAPVILTPDADLDFAAQRCAVGAFSNSGQVCISVQRIYVDRKIYTAFLDRFVAATRALKVGDPLDPTVDVGPMIDPKEAERIEGWVREAVAGGARVAIGGKREGAVYWPTILTGVTDDMKVVSQEAFAPIAVVIPTDDFETALAHANNTKYGLQAAIFSRDIDRVLQGVKRLNFGGVIINDTANYRADHMPYGGNRQSGMGREGVRYAIEEMTNIQMVVIRMKP